MHKSHNKTHKFRMQREVGGDGGENLKASCISEEKAGQRSGQLFSIADQNYLEKRFSFLISYMFIY